MTDLPPITLPAEHVIPAWRNAYMASSDDKHRMSLYRTVYVEWFSSGLRFVATDGYVLVASWADHNRHSAANIAPDRDVAPVGSVLALAADNLMPDFLKHRQAEVKAWQRAEFEGLDADPVDVTFSIGTIDDPNTGQQRLDIGEQRALIVSAANERIALPLLDDGAKFPAWRSTLAGYKPMPRERVRAGAALLDRLGRLRTGAPADVLDLTMAKTSGRDATELVLVAGVGRVPVEGAFVPLREADERAEDEAA